MNIFEMIFVGVGASLIMDLYGFVLKKYFAVLSLDYRLVGRWLVYLSKGQLIHKNILQTRPVRCEIQLGWLSHYLIGVLFAACYILWIVKMPYNPLSLALLFGLATVIFPFLILQPCLGFGLAARKMTFPWLTRLKSIGHHVIFGLGLYLSFQSYHYA